MLYVLIEAQRARLMKLQKDNELKKWKSTVSEDKGYRTTGPSGLGVAGQRCCHKPVSSLLLPPIQDAEWFTLSPQEKLAWAKASKDPRIAVGQQSPLEKEILNLGGVHTTAARHLLTRKCQEEYETLCREQALSLDYWLAKAESYYNKRVLDMMKKGETGDEMKSEMEENVTQSIEGPKRNYWVPKRERKQIEVHIHRAGQAREVKNKTLRQPRPLKVTTLPKIKPEKRSVQKEQRRKQVLDREELQIKDHQERMVRGRELIEQRLRERILRRSQSQPPAREKHGRVQRQTAEFERVIAYPLFQPYGTSPIKVNILMEKSPNREEMHAILRPYERKFLAVPPFLRSQIQKIKC